MPDILVGCALSDVNRADLPLGLRVPERLGDYAKRYQAQLASDRFFFELQPEDFWTVPVDFPDEFIERKTNRWWRTFRNNTSLWRLFKDKRAFVGVHQPVHARDALSSNYFNKYAAIEETKQAMAFAHFIGANYFVFHLATQDRWEWDRRDQINKALKILRVFAAYYHAHDFKFVPCIELLTYPKFPATGGEARDLLNKCRVIWEELQIAFDVSHLWGSRQRMIAAGLWDAGGTRALSFIDALDYAIAEMWCDTHVFRLGGCWESEMHAVPGLHPQQDPFHYPMKLRESPGVYAEMGEIDLNRTLELLLNYTVRRDRPLNLVLQIFDRDIDQVLEATRVIQAELRDRAAQPPPEAPVEPPTRPRKRARRATEGNGRSKDE